MVKVFLIYLFSYLLNIQYYIAKVLRLTSEK